MTEKNTGRAAERKRRLEALKAKAHTEGTLDALFPTREHAITFGTAIVQPLAMATAPAPALEERPPEGELAALAHEINYRFAEASKLDGRADDHRLAAALRLAEARKLCEAKRLNFRRWAEASVPQTYETVRKLASIGASDNPARALADLRSRSAAGMRRRRAQQQIAASPFDAAQPAYEDAPLALAAPVEDPAPAQAETAPDLMPQASLRDALEALAHLTPAGLQELGQTAILRLPADAARDILAHLAEVLGMRLLRSNEGGNFFVTTESLLADLRQMEPAQQREFMARAAEAVHEECR